MVGERKKGGLGFNTALLGKQVWRLIRNSNLLVSRIQRAKYYPKDSSFFYCKMPNNISWFWQTIMLARDIVKEGLMKRVGTGKSINI